MAELSPLAFNSIVAAVGLLLYIFAWRVTSDLPPAAKVFSRLALTVVAVVPILLGIFFGAATPDRMATRDQKPAASAPSSPSAGGEVSGGAMKRTPSPTTTQPSQPSQPSMTTKSQDDAALGQQPDAAVKSAPPTAASPSPMTEAAAPSPSASTRGMTKSAPSAAAPVPAPVVEPPADYDVVPVFYGTDRGAKQMTTRIQYDAERAKRLDLGRAMVTVPKTHEMPNIERPWVYRIPLTNIVIYQEAEDPKKHFTMKEVKSLTRDEFIALVKSRLEASARFKDHALVFVHGFNTTFDYAIYRAAQLAYDLKFDGAPFVYSWPSKGQVGFQDYNYDRGSADQTAPYLTDFLKLVSQSTGAKKVSVIAHSMGNLAVMRVLRDLKNAAPQGVEISQLIMAAPDVDRDLFENLAVGIQDVAKGATLYASSNDWALEASKRLDGVPRAGDVPSGIPLVLAGIDTIDVTAISTEIFALRHSGYAEKTALVQDIERILQTGERPPISRLPSLETVSSPRGPFWRYPKP